MLKNQLMQLETRSSMDARLIVFLHYQKLFLVFSRETVDVYNSHLKRVHSYVRHSFLFFSFSSPSFNHFSFTSFHLVSCHSIPFFYHPIHLPNSLPKNTKYADNTHDNIAHISPNQDMLVCYYCDIHRTGKVDMYDLITGEQYFSRDSRGDNPPDNYALEDVSSISYDFEKDILYTGRRFRRWWLIVGTRAGLLHIWSITRDLDE